MNCHPCVRNGPAKIGSPVWTTFATGSSVKPPEGGGLLDGNPPLDHSRFSSQIQLFQTLPGSSELAGVASKHAGLARRKGQSQGELDALGEHPKHAHLALARPCREADNQQRSHDGESRAQQIGQRWPLTFCCP
jgi:hypothetical protein